jgi:hypothetical protein
MKTLHYLFFLIGLVLISSCSKKHDNTDILLNHKDVIIGCKTGQPITLGVDPIKDNEFNFKNGLCNAVVAGPSCLNGKKDLYYSAGDDKMIDEVEISSGNVKRSFQTTGYTLLIHYRATDNSLIYMESTSSMHEYAVFKIDLNSGTISSLFTFTSNYGMAIRTSFIRNNNIFFMNGMGELLKLDLSTSVLSMVLKLNCVTNSLVYDNKLDKVFYMASPNHVDFSLYCYSFSNNSDVLLKNYPDIKTHLLGSTSYNSGNNNYYMYTSNERITIDVISLARKIEKVKFTLINTEIVDCTVRQNDILIEN